MLYEPIRTPSTQSPSPVKHLVILIYQDILRVVRPQISYIQILHLVNRGVFVYVFEFIINTALALEVEAAAED